MQNDRVELCLTKKQKIKQALIYFVTKGNMFFTPLWANVVDILETPCEVCSKPNPKADE